MGAGENGGGTDVMKVMVTTLLGLVGFLAALTSTLTPKKSGGASQWLACPTDNPSKRAWEVFNLFYSGVWVGCFAVIISLGLYERFDELAYMVVCGGLSLPIFLFPVLWPAKVDARLPLTERFAARANLWMAVYSFIGNYWYTHYFYSVLGAKYTFPSWRLNDVPIPLYFATFFYFSMYHVFSNAAIRRVVTGYEPGAARLAMLVALVGVMSYVTAFMETLTISGFPYYSFEDRDMAYKLGSAFYGIYFIVSFPAFYAFDEWPKKHGVSTLWETTVNSMGAGMLILTLLDLVRLAVGVPLTVKG